MEQMNVATSTRTRTRRTSPGEPLPSAEGKHFVRLARGRIYHLLTPDILFRQGETKEVPKAVYDHLSANAVDTLAYDDPEVGTVRRTIAKFEFSPPVPGIPDQIIGW